MNAQRFSMFVGLAIVAVHIGITFFLFLKFDAPADSKVVEINTPVTLAYVSSIAMWFFENKGNVTSRETVGLPFVILVIMIVGAMLSGLLGVLVAFEHNLDMTVEQLNKTFLYLEGAFGGIFGFVLTKLFAVKQSDGAAANNGG